MALRSMLFRGDPRLEAAAVRDSAHIVRGAAGPHVEKIQLALMLLDDARIADHELAADLYGSSTAAAVLAYKRRRNIVNRAYQSSADNIVGRMTMATLDDEMAGREVLYRTRGCNYGPSGRVQHRQAFLGMPPWPGPLPPSGVQTTLDMALAAVPAARAMRDRAKVGLDDVIGGSSTPLAEVTRSALSRHYKVSAAPEVDRVARELRNALAQISGRLLSARAWLRQGQGGGFAETPQPRDGHSYIMRDYATAGILMRPTILIHEAFHDLSDTHQDFGGNPANDRGARYHRNDTVTQLRNAYAMSQFVLHVHAGEERILGDSE
ncbi:MAG: hypothetical protein MUF21_08370 [Gemmatimonadaceae bacterium]|nr:hypothetical protein [Gemmatimonadaceae bacterium]